ncbi:hypothetical protein, partial [Pantoea sp. ANP04]|uniref:hypothetical protein n=1 Tax=Pantoea sp. ANP04 TaxID=3064896 RepID=UPI0035C5D620
MKKFICAALAAITCLSVGVMASAANANYYSNTGLAHTNCNAHKYTVSAEEWQNIINKDEDSNPQTNDMIRVRFYFDELRYEMFEGNTLLHEYNYANEDFLGVLKSIATIVAPSSA